MSEDFEEELLDRVANKSDFDANKKLEFQSLDPDEDFSTQNARMPQENARMPTGNARMPEENARMPQANARMPTENARMPEGEDSKLLRWKIKRVKVNFAGKNGMENLRVDDLDTLSQEELIARYEEAKSIALGGIQTDGGIPRQIYEVTSTTAEIGLGKYGLNAKGMTYNALYNRENPQQEQIMSCLKLIDIEMGMAVQSGNPYVMLGLASLMNARATIAANEVAAVQQQKPKQQEYKDVFAKK